MSWMENLVPASWRNIDFYVDESSFKIGRRIAVHEFVQRDNPFIEDLGRKNREIQIKGYLIASKENNFNPWDERDVLIQAVEEGGKGKLVHPYYGELEGHITSDFLITESATKNGGRVGFEFTFIESGEETFTRAMVVNKNTQAFAQLKATTTYTNIKTDFNKAFSVDNAPSFVRDSAVKDINTFLSKINTFNPVTLSNQLGISAALQATQAAKNTLQSIVNGAYMGAASVSNSIITIISTAQDLGDLNAWVLPPVSPFNTLNRRKERQNAEAMRNMIVAATATRQAELAIDLYSNSERFNADTQNLEQLITLEEMQQTRLNLSQSITGVIESLSEQSIFDDTQSALTALRTAAIQHITAQGENLARTFETSVCDTTVAQNYQPALVVAYRHYGELLDESIIARNKIENPLFIAPHRTLKLLALNNLETYNGRV